MTAAILAELRKIRAALDTRERIYVDYVTAAKMLCTSKRSIERFVSEKRIRTYDIAGPKLRVVDLARLGDAKATRRAPRPAKPRPARLMERVKAMAAQATEGTPRE